MGRRSGLAQGSRASGTGGGGGGLLRGGGGAEGRRGITYKDCAQLPAPPPPAAASGLQTTAVGAPPPPHERAGTPPPLHGAVVHQGDLKMFRVLSDNVRMLLASGSDAVVVIDVDEVIHYWNPQAEAIFGWTAEEAVGQNLSIILPEDLHGGKHSAYVRRVLETGALNTKGLVRCVRASGHGSRGPSTRRNGDGPRVRAIRDRSVPSIVALLLGCVAALQPPLPPAQAPP